MKRAPPPAIRADSPTTVKVARCHANSALNFGDYYLVVRKRKFNLLGPE